MKRLWGGLTSALSFLKDVVTFNHEEQRTLYWLLWLFALTGIIWMAQLRGRAENERDQRAAYTQALCLKRPTNQLEADFYLCLAKERIERHNLPEQGQNPILELAAQVRLRDMQQRHYFSHFGPGDQGEAYKAALNIYRAEVDENIYWGYPDANTALQGFLSSTDHRPSMLSKYTKIGCAAGPLEVDGRTQTLFVVLFGNE